MPQAKEQRSLFGEILDWMLAPLLLLWPMSVALTWLVAQNIAHKPYDRELGTMVRVLAKQVAVHTEAGKEVAEFALPVSAADLSTITEPDLRASGVFSGGLDPDGSRKRGEA